MRLCKVRSETVLCRLTLPSTTGLLRKPGNWDITVRRRRRLRLSSINTEDYETAAKLSNNCRSKGIAVSVPDMVICAIALTRGWSVFTNDPDFENYKNILQIKLHKARK